MLKNAPKPLLHIADVSGSCRIIKTKIEYETKSKIKMEWGAGFYKARFLFLECRLAIQVPNWVEIIINILLW